MLKLTHSALVATCERVGTPIVRQRKHHFFKEIQQLIPSCVRKLSFDDETARTRNDDNIHTETSPDPVSEYFEPKVVDAISNAVSRFAIYLPRSTVKDRVRSVLNRSNRSLVPCITDRWCQHLTEDDHFDRINAWVMSSPMFEKQTAL